MELPDKNVVIIEVKGMRCPNCERHVREAVENAFDGVTVTADRTRNEVVIESADPVDVSKVKALISEAGYTVG